MKRILATVISFSIALFSCKKNKTCELNESNFSGVFKRTSIINKQSASDPGIDYVASWTGCQKDDLLYIKPDGKTVYVDAGVICLPSNDGIGAWSLSGNNIVMDGGAGTVSYFDCKHTTLVFPQPTPGATITVSLERQ